MTNDDLTAFRDVAVAAARQAGRLIQQHAGRLHDEAVRAKGVHDLVTEIDEASQALILERLIEAFPDHAILAEEGADAEAVRTPEGYRWIVDPIDGTTNFTHGVPPYAVSIGLQHRDDLVVGVVLDVSRDELFTAVRGGGLYVNGARAGVSRTDALDDSLLTTGFPYRSFDHVDPYLKVLRTFMRETRGLRRPGSASIDLAYVACGRFEGFFETGLSPWDVAAGTLLVEEGGGRVTDFEGKRLPLFAGQILATNGPLHAAMQERLEPLRRVNA